MVRVHNKSCLFHRCSVVDTLEDTNTTVAELYATFGAIVAGVVAEVTDDKSLPKDERKRLQVANAEKKTKRAKLVKLADKLDNCRSLVELPPPNWSKERIQGYFVWTKAVLAGLRGTNLYLEQTLDKLLETEKFPVPGTPDRCPCLPRPEEEANALAAYYNTMSQATH